jgi:hypothetical protein
MIVEFGIQALTNGESALRMALLQLGLADVYHMVELWEERTPKTTTRGSKHSKPNTRARARNGVEKNGTHYKATAW